MVSKALPDNATPFVLGLAGGIGAGKSHVALAFARLGWRVFDFDVLTREALASEEVCRTIAQWWGPDVLDDDGHVNRMAVGKIVFDDESQRQRLEALIHPMVWRTRAQAIEAAKNAGAPGVIFDAPLLFEAGLEVQCDAVVFVHADEATREARVKSTRGWSREELLRRETAQSPIDEKRGKCRFFVDNSLGAKALDEQIADVIAIMIASGSGGHPLGRDT